MVFSCIEFLNAILAFFIGFLDKKSLKIKPYLLLPIPFRNFLVRMIKINLRFPSDTFIANFIMQAMSLKKA